jgi:hypothetical protein
MECTIQCRSWEAAAAVAAAACSWIIIMIYDDGLASVCLGAYAAARKSKTHAAGPPQNEATTFTTCR